MCLKTKLKRKKSEEAFKEYYYYDTIYRDRNGFMKSVPLKASLTETDLSLSMLKKNKNK